MQKNLVIVESPAKAKTIEKFLGKDYKVMSSYGHIRDLKKKRTKHRHRHIYARLRDSRREEEARDRAEEQRKELRESMARIR